AATRTAPRRSPSCCSRSRSRSCSRSAGSDAMPRGTSVGKVGLRIVALGYLFVILLAPLGLVFYRTFAHDSGAAWNALSNQDTLHAFRLTLTAVAIAVPLNAVFGVICGLAIVRGRFPGKGLLNAFVDLPLALSPVVVGVAAARCLGEYGAVAVVSGNIQGRTQTATLAVQDYYENLDQAGAYAISLALAAIAVVVLVLMTVIRPREAKA